MEWNVQLGQIKSDVHKKTKNNQFNLGVWWTYYLNTILCRFMSLELSKNLSPLITLSMEDGYFVNDQDLAGDDSLH